ncbi:MULTISPECIES: TRAP transporter small permease [Desulfosediminicola]|uniref:TRAP transporter small permease n=1 Tax=Desulfosediminicola TaxID=2886823 RepID=UPI0010AC20F7|nr:TRAP transporter small permease [Desulfosediminicola ganghwensis]
MGILWKSIKWLDENVEYWLCFVFYSYMAGIIVVEVCRRYFFNASSSWGEETAIYAFIWMTYLAAARGVRGRKHLSVEALRHRMTRTQKYWAFVLSDVSFLILAVTVAYYSLIPVTNSIQYGHTMFGIDLPLALATSSITAGWILIAIRVVQRFLDTLRRFRMGLPLAEEQVF